MTLLTLAHLSIAFGDRTVVDDVSLTLEKGSITALVGESGSGKTLTAQSILQLLPPEATTRGTVSLNGTPVAPAAIHALRGDRIGMIFQEPMSALNPLHTIDRQIIESFCLHRQLPRRSSAAQAKLKELLEAVGLTHFIGRGDIYPHQMSGGERQRAMIAMAIANDPDLLIADEPTTALDVTLQRQILSLLQQLQKARGMAMLFITHDLPVVRAIADQVAVMHQGKIVESGPTETIFTAARHPYTQLLLAATPSGKAPPPPADAPEILNAQLSVRFPVKSGLLRRTTGMITAVNDVPIRLRRGETLGIVGESGSGKSSLGLALLRLIDADGPILFLNHRLDTQKRQALRGLRQHMQLVFQDPYGALNPRMTVREIIGEGLALHQPHRHDHETQIRAMIEQVGLRPEMLDRYPHAFSGGQRQRIAIARAMILKPALVVLDEPTSALDMSVQAQVLELLRHLQRASDVAYLFISHDLRVIRAMAHQVLVLHKGVAVEHGPTDKIFENPQYSYTQTLLAAAFGHTA